MSTLKMYIVIKDTVKTGMAINSVAHGVLMAEDRWRWDKDYVEWRSKSFKKVTCRADEDTFHKVAMAVSDLVMVTESALEGEITVLVIKPVPEHPDLLKGLSLY